MATHKHHPTDPLAKLTPQQQDGVTYLLGLPSAQPQEQDITVRLRDDGIAVFTSERRAAVIAPSGDFMDPAAEPGQAQVTLPYSEYAPDVHAHRRAQAQLSSQDN